MDTVRLIAERTDDLLAEVWKYIKDGKLAETALQQFCSWQLKRRSARDLLSRKMAIARQMGLVLSLMFVQRMLLP